jgi:chemotaxis protein methyltransferase CheR
MNSDLTPILEFLTQEIGLCPHGERSVSIADGVRRTMVRSGADSVDAFLSHIRRDTSAFDELVAEVTVGETYFFREPDQFRVLRETILPEISARKGSDHVVRIWSAACASGEEAWSLAIACRQAGFGDQCRIRATDISRTALRRAELGSYRKWSFRGPSREFADVWFDETNDGWQISDRLRAHVTFDYLNLALDCYPSLTTGTVGCDVILCRNVLIYFEPETIRLVAQRLFESLSPGGWLILAATDPTIAELAPLEAVPTPAGVVYRRPLLPSEAPDTAVPSLATTSGLSVFDDPPIAESGTSDSTLIASEDQGIRQAQAALEQGDYDKVRILTESQPDSSDASALLVRALTCLDTTDAENACASAVARHPTSGELQYLHAVLLLELECYVEAEQAVRRALFLDRKLVVAHFSLGIILQRSGDALGARRAFRNAIDLCSSLTPDAVLPLSDGEPAGRLMQMAKQHLALLGDADSSPKS